MSRSACGFEDIETHRPGASRGLFSLEHIFTTWQRMPKKTIEKQILFVPSGVLSLTTADQCKTTKTVNNGFHIFTLKFGFHKALKAVWFNWKWQLFGFFTNRFLFFFFIIPLTSANVTCAEVRTVRIDQQITSTQRKHGNMRNKVLSQETTNSKFTLSKGLGFIFIIHSFCLNWLLHE